jgi:hypothetical protein
MADILDLAIFGSSTAHRQDLPHVYYTKRLAWTPQWFHVSFVFLGVTKFVHQGAKKLLFFISSSAHRQDRPQVYYTKMTGYLDILETFLISDF